MFLNVLDCTTQARLLVLIATVLSTPSLPWPLKVVDLICTPSPSLT